MKSERDSGLRVAVVGCGYWGSKHVRVLHDTQGVAEVILVDSVKDRLENSAAGRRRRGCDPADHARGDRAGGNRGRGRWRHPIARGSVTEFHVNGTTQLVALPEADGSSGLSVVQPRLTASSALAG